MLHTSASLHGVHAYNSACNSASRSTAHACALHQSASCRRTSHQASVMLAPAPSQRSTERRPMLPEIEQSAFESQARAGAHAEVAQRLGAERLAARQAGVHGERRRAAVLVDAVQVLEQHRARLLQLRSGDGCQARAEQAPESCFGKDRQCLKVKTVCNAVKTASACPFLVPRTEQDGLCRHRSAAAGSGGSACCGALCWTALRGLPRVQRAAGALCRFTHAC